MYIHFIYIAVFMFYSYWFDGSDFPIYGNFQLQFIPMQWVELWTNAFRVDDGHFILCS